MRAHPERAQRAQHAQRVGVQHDVGPREQQQEEARRVVHAHPFRRRRQRMACLGAGQTQSLSLKP